MTQQAKSPAPKLDNLNSIPRTYLVEAEKLSSGHHVCVMRKASIGHH